MAQKIWANFVCIILAPYCRYPANNKGCSQSIGRKSGAGYWNIGSGVPKASAVSWLIHCWHRSRQSLDNRLTFNQCIWVSPHSTDWRLTVDQVLIQCRLGIDQDVHTQLLMPLVHVIETFSPLLFFLVWCMPTLMIALKSVSKHLWHHNNHTCIHTSYELIIRVWELTEHVCDSWFNPLSGPMMYWVRHDLFSLSCLFDVLSTSKLKRFSQKPGTWEATFVVTLSTP